MTITVDGRERQVFAVNHDDRVQVADCYLGRVHIVGTLRGYRAELNETTEETIAAFARAAARNWPTAWLNAEATVIDGAPRRLPERKIVCEETVLFLEGQFYEAVHFKHNDVADLRKISDKRISVQ